MLMMTLSPILAFESAMTSCVVIKASEARTGGRSRYRYLEYSGTHPDAARANKQRASPTLLRFMTPPFFLPAFEPMKAGHRRYSIRYI